MVTIKVEAKDLVLCVVKAEFTSELTREETSALMNWCDCQHENLWDGLSLQEILNVYRASAKWDTWTGWAEEDEAAAAKAYNEAVLPKNRMLGGEVAA